MSALADRGQAGAAGPWGAPSIHRLEPCSWRTATPFPEGTGIRIEPGSMLVVQMHYNTERLPWR